MKYFKYLRYLFWHKWYVMLACWQNGLYWLGFIHDWSKLLPSEFIPYANYFYGKKASDIKKGRDATGYYKPTDTGDMAFDFAWLLHQKRNKHHWQWWILPEDEGGVKVLPMPRKYLIEMLCDWKGAGRAQGSKLTVKQWYEANRNKMQLNPATEQDIEDFFNAEEKRIRILGY